MILLLLAVVLAAASILWARQDPRRLRIGFAAVAAVLLALYGLLVLAANAPVRIGPASLGAWTVLGAVGVSALGSLVLAGYLLFNGVQMLRREGRSPAHLLSLLAGLAILGYLVVAVASVAFDSPQVAAWVLLAFPLVVTAGLLFTGVLVTSLVHARLARRHLGDARAIVVLGAGLIAGRVPPLLAGRLREGARVADLVRASHPSAPLVVSGGHGADEPTAEGHAMRAWYTEHPELAADPVLVEDRSHTTEENLRLSAALLAEHGVTGPLVAVTSDYHALRAATLLRRLGLPGDAVGARTAAYYRPSAFLREVVALLRDHRVVTAIVLALAAAPIPLALGVLLVDALG
ncbi:YdcF family protein [Pseudoclavibacter caeni]|nr:YdcF family protein [Pseudoclavibacter caeni]NYJ96916.1 uncharacterized SAM-binding protein YcdF (DUF218 family) [Pseudoclavibacter caeni]